MAAEPAGDGDRSGAARWVVAPRIGRGEQDLLGSESLLLAQLLWNRGVRTATAANTFLAPPSLSGLGDPFAMRGMDAAVDCLVRAIRDQAPVAVYGDYDVDGVAGAAVLVEALRSLGATVLVHLPHRVRDGYGLKEEALRGLAAQGARVVVTADCGITADREVELAAALGLQVVVTDHHTIPARLPAAAAVLNPHQPECQYPCKDLAGGGVAFQLARALLGHLLPTGAAEAQALQLADLAALSTVADVVPLVGENRTLVALGLQAMRAGQRPGLRALCEVAAKTPSELTARDLAFAIIPRLNAAGRLGEAGDAMDLLLARDDAEAERLAGQLNSTNETRRALMQDLLEPIQEDAAESAGEGAVVLEGPYPIGLAGLLAARVVDRWRVPCAVIQRGDSPCRGSARAPEGANLMDILGECRGTLIQFGGHARAAGFTISATEIDRFRAAFAGAARALVADRDRLTPPPVVADAALRLRSIGPALADLVERFEPSGEGSSSPTFVSRGVVLSVASFGEGAARIRLRDGDAVRRAVAYQPTAPLKEGNRVDLLYEVRRTVWRGDQRVDLMVRDLQFAPTL